MTLTIDEAIARVPFLVGAKKLEKTVLGGGITNLNYKIDYDGKSCVIRIVDASTGLLGIRREVECAANTAAGLLGIAPKCCISSSRKAAWSPAISRAGTSRPRRSSRRTTSGVWRKLRLFHTRAPELQGQFNVFRRVEMLTKVSQGNNCKFPFDFDWIMQKMRQVEGRFPSIPLPLTPCHNDLLNLNWMDEEVAGEIGELRLLDWEYGGMGDIFFDLGNFCHHHRLTEDQERLLLHEYFGGDAQKFRSSAPDGSHVGDP